MTYWQLRAETDGGAVFSCGLYARDRLAAEEAARDRLPPSFLRAPVWLVVTEVAPLEDRVPQAP